jgi:hypothetical protein
MFKGSRVSLAAGVEKYHKKLENLFKKGIKVF